MRRVDVGRDPVRSDGAQGLDLRLPAMALFALSGIFIAVRILGPPLLVAMVLGVLTEALVLAIGLRALPPWRGNETGKRWVLGFAVVQFVVVAVVVV